MERGQVLHSPESRMRRTPQAPALRGDSGRGRGNQTRSPRPPLPPQGISWPQQKLPGLLTSDSRRWLLNASRPLGDACFPLPPPLPLPLLLPLAGGLPVPGATGSSMRLGSAAPLSCSAVSAPGYPAAARRLEGPTLSTAIGCGRCRSPAPQRDWLFGRGAGLGRGGGSIQGFFPPFFFFLFFFSFLVLRRFW